MGGWGYDDDESDDAADLWQETLDSIGQKAWDVDWLMDHQKQLFAKVRKVLKKHQHDHRREPESPLLGLILRCVKFIMFPNRQQYLGGVATMITNEKRRQRLQLPCDFPKDLAKIAAGYALVMLERLENGENRLGWRDLRKRKMRLRRIYGLFS